MVLVGHGGDRRHFCDHTQRSDHALVRIGNVGRVVIEGRESADRATHDGHRMCVATIAGEESAHLLMHHGVTRDAGVEILLLRSRRQFAVEQQVAGFQEIALFGKLLDREAAVKENAFVTIDIGDLGFAGGRRREARVVGEGARVLVQRGDIDDAWSNRAFPDREFDLFFAKCHCSAFFRHTDPPKTCGWGR
ncbi:hypothetical protein D3C87_938570 [compost metagenome]